MGTASVFFGPETLSSLGLQLRGEFIQRQKPGCCLPCTDGELHPPKTQWVAETDPKKKRLHMMIHVRDHFKIICRCVSLSFPKFCTGGFPVPGGIRTQVSKAPNATVMMMAGRKGILERLTVC